MMRVGLVGSGYWAEEVHGPRLAAHPGVELVGVWGRDPGKTGRIAGILDTTPYADVDAFVEDVDTVAFAVPPAVQAPLAVAAARRGRHLLLEKPIALDPVVAGELVSAVEAAEVSTVVFTTLRFDPRIAAWVEHCALRGGWQGFSGRWVGAIVYPGSPYLESHWRMERGGLWDLGPHALSIVLPILGPAERVVATQGPDDLVQLDLVHASGALSALSLTIKAPPAAEHTVAEVWGTDGIEHLPDTRQVSHLEAYTVAIDRLLADVADGVTDSDLGVVAGARSVEVLAEAQRQLTG